MSATIVSALVCSSTDVVVTTPARSNGRAAQVAAAMGAPLVLATEKSPYDAEAIGAARVWTNQPSVVVSGRHAVLPLPDLDGEPPKLVTSLTDGALPEATRPEVIAGVIGESSASKTLVMVSPDRPQLAGVAAAAADAVGGETVWAPPGDMRNRRILGPLAGASTGRLLVGDFSDDAPWQTDVLARGLTLPGGGQVLFPGKMIVTLYGHPHTGALGVLGEQSPADAVARAADVAAPYATEGMQLIPGFDIITTLASSSAGRDGDYSTELSVEDLRPWVEAASEAGMYVVLDLQPGRTDFLTQAKRYAELLALPNVGLALDPEWRLASDEVHLRQIGSVTGEEVNTVVDWLAGLVRRERLPQKLLLVHQFSFGMISSREVIRTPSELAVVVQMDGQGPLSTKYSTWNALVAGDHTWRWGWKNFYDEDSPMATPSQVLDLDPLPVFISFQ
ncbi:MAG TPA: hypothetical protein VJ938_00915 [Acidimicrobiia bacterium]|nr:hypothetical protein [Acidimicrobiia bacterium]